MDSTGKLTAAPAPAARQGLWLAVVVLTALNLRPFLTAVGSLAHDIAAATGLDLRGMAWLTLLPMLLMGLGAWCGPALQQRLGARRVLLGALVVLAAGSALCAWAPGGAALSVALAPSSSGTMASSTRTRSPCTVMVTFLFSCACSCCSWRRSTSLAVLTNVLNAFTSSGLGFFLSRPIVQGPTSAGSSWPCSVIATAQPSSSSFLMTRAVQRSSCHRRGS